MAATIAVADGVFAFRQLGCCGAQHGVHGLGVGEVDCAQATHIPARQSIMGLKQALPAGMENSVMSVS